ncbi:MAG: hypothetical protein WD607_01980 [Candidatus Paceibacterota bacterium]
MEQEIKKNEECLDCGELVKVGAIFCVTCFLLVSVPYIKISPDFEKWKMSISNTGGSGSHMYNASVSPNSLNLIQTSVSGTASVIDLEDSDNKDSFI